MNYVRTAVLLAAMTALFIGIGWLLGGVSGMIIALVIALAMNAFAYWNSDKLVLRMYRARPATRASEPALFGIVEQLVARADMPMPKIYVIDDDQPNAFATGRNPENAAVAATSGLLKQLSAEEVAGVMAHELAHIKNRDTLIMTITATVAGAISMLSQFALFFGHGRNNALGIVGALLVMIVGPLAAAMVQMAISRAREYEADRVGAEICGRPLWLASALHRLGVLSGRIENRVAEENPATAHLFIVNPLHTHKVDSLFSTHPSLQKRIARLHAMAEDAGQAAETGPWS